MKWKTAGVVLVVILILAATVSVSGCVFCRPDPKPEPEPDPKPARIDSDGDGMSDWFEKNVAQLDPNVSNDRYMFWMSSIDISGMKKESFNRIFIEVLNRIFIEDYKFLPENVIIKERATFSDFKRIVDQLVEKSDENDLVYIHITSHGGPTREFETIRAEPSNVQVRFTGRWIGSATPTMWFANEDGGEYGESLTYKELGEILNKIRCKKMLVTYASCAGRLAVEVLNNDAAYPRVVIGSIAPTNAIGYGGIFNYQFFDENHPYYHLKDDYLSVEDFFKYHPQNFPEERVLREVQRIEESIRNVTIYSGNPTIEMLALKMSDPHNISSRFYFGEATVEDLFQGAYETLWVRQNVHKKAA